MKRFYDNEIMYESVSTDKRIIQSSKDIYSFQNVEEGMLIKKNKKELGIYTGFVLGDNLNGDYLIELAQEFEQNN